MGLNLIMPRTVFTIINDLCDKYEQKFKERVATASVVNVLLAEALIHRGLIPKDYIKEHYGCENPIEQGFTPNARKEKSALEKQRETEKLQQVEKVLTLAYEQWDSLRESVKAYHLKTAM
ncbi:MAG: hypothetical protein ACPLYF_05510, partial [Fervidobacterium sp.]